MLPDFNQYTYTYPGINLLLTTIVALLSQAIADLETILTYGISSGRYAQ